MKIASLHTHIHIHIYESLCDVCSIFLSLVLCSRLRSMFLAGERCDIETLEWAKKSFGVPVLDHWWQTGRNMFFIFEVEIVLFIR